VRICCRALPAVQPTAQAAASQQDIERNVSRSACGNTSETIVINENARADTEFVDSRPSFIDADEFHLRSYIELSIECLPVQKALIDGGSEICCINSDVIKHLNLPASKQVRLSGLCGKSNVVDVVRLHVKPALHDNASIVNIAPTVRA
jgi:hypothetical protein